MYSARSSKPLIIKIVQIVSVRRCPY